MNTHSMCFHGEIRKQKTICEFPLLSEAMEDNVFRNQMITLLGHLLLVV